MVLGQVVMGRLFSFYLWFASWCWKQKVKASATSYESTTSGHMCDMDWCVLRTSLSLRNFGRRFYGY